jgi:hypothetical protein
MSYFGFAAVAISGFVVGLVAAGPRSIKKDERSNQKQSNVTFKQVIPYDPNYVPSPEHVEMYNEAIKRGEYCERPNKYNIMQWGQMGSNMYPPSEY